MTPQTDAMIRRYTSLLALTFAVSCTSSSDSTEDIGNSGATDGLADGTDAADAPDATDGVDGEDGTDGQDGGATEPPAVLRFPAAVGIELGKLGQDQKADSAAIATTIEQGPGLLMESQQVVDTILAALHTIEIPVGADVTAHDASLVVGGSPELAAHFDFTVHAGDAPEGAAACSGNTGALPVCFRLSLGGEPFIAGRFESWPTDSSAGSGHFVMRQLASLGGGETGTGIAARWEHAADGTRRTEIHWGVPGDDGESFVAFRHAVITATGHSPEAVTKTLSLHDNLAAAPTPSELLYIGRWREDAELWVGRAEASGVFESMLGLSGFPTLCATIGTWQTAADGACVEAGLAIDDVLPVPLATATDVSLPATFLD